jgi:hypothetical protein
MTTPIAALVLCIIHTSLVVAATMIARSCVARRFAASRAVVGGVGMSCILFVTLLTFLPLPSVWSTSDRTALQSAEASGGTNQKASAPNYEQMSGSWQSHSAKDSTNGIDNGMEWLRRVGDSLRNATVAADMTPHRWQNLLMILLLSGIGAATVRFLAAFFAVRRLYRTSTMVTNKSVASMAVVTCPQE